MSERKVLNKYYPPDFDPAKIPKLKLAKDRQYVIRLMAPFNMRCKTCGEYIYKGKKFNARKETVLNETYLGLPIFRFYIKCTKCVAEITFKTDPENTDYAIEHGATRNFQAEKLIEEEQMKMQKEKEEEELNNPMKVLENRTKDSKLEMEIMENLEELKELNQRQANVDFDKMLRKHLEVQEEMCRRKEEEEEREIKELLSSARVKRIQEDNSDSDDDSPANKRFILFRKATDVLTEDTERHDQKKQKTENWEHHQVSSSGLRSKLKDVIVKKPASKKNAGMLEGLSCMGSSTDEKVASSVKIEGLCCSQELTTGAGNPSSLAECTSVSQSTMGTRGTGFALLGTYSDSSSGGESET
uniref:splicing factor YJU2 n=1 Tax=Myxine glutinosa TaxID=7769 RepID=UPI00358E66A3